MKLIHCDACGDYVALSYGKRTCHCGRSGGGYVNARKAWVSGPCTVLGVENRVLHEGRAEAFVIAEPNEHVERRGS